MANKASQRLKAGDKIVLPDGKTTVTLADVFGTVNVTWLDDNGALQRGSYPHGQMVQYVEPSK